MICASNNLSSLAGVSEAERQRLMPPGFSSPLSNGSPSPGLTDLLGLPPSSLASHFPLEAPHSAFCAGASHLPQDTRVSLELLAPCLTCAQEVLEPLCRFPWKNLGRS